MYNQAVIYDEKGNVVRRGVYPTILMTTFAKIDDSGKIVTVDAKEEGDVVYVVGSVSKADMGGSEYVNMYSEAAGKEFTAGRVSDEDISDVFDTFGKMNKAAETGLLQSAKYVEAGGIAMALRDTAMAGQLGVDVELKNVRSERGIDLHELMYGETEGRFLVTVKRGSCEAFEKLFAGKFSRIGSVSNSGTLEIKYNGSKAVSESVDDLIMDYHKRGAA
jgi:phosphoribosylformylglycinamidine synthase